MRHGLIMMNKEEGKKQPNNRAWSVNMSDVIIFPNDKNG